MDNVIEQIKGNYSTTQHISAFNSGVEQLNIFDSFVSAICTTKNTNAKDQTIENSKEKNIAL